MQTTKIPKSHEADEKLMKTSTFLPPEMWKRLVNHVRENGNGMTKSEFICKLIEKELSQA